MPKPRRGGGLGASCGSPVGGIATRFRGPDRTSGALGWAVLLGWAAFFGWAGFFVGAAAFFGSRSRGFFGAGTPS